MCCLAAKTFNERKTHVFLELSDPAIGSVQAGYYEQGRNWEQLDYGVYADRSGNGRYRTRSFF
jgi:hypothetical protein